MTFRDDETPLCVNKKDTRRLTSPATIISHNIVRTPPVIRTSFFITQFNMSHNTPWYFRLNRKIPYNAGEHARDVS